MLKVSLQVEAIAKAAGPVESVLSDSGYYSEKAVLSVAKAMKEFEYDKEKGGFKSWLLTITRINIHVIRHRVGGLVKKELKRLEEKLL